MFSVTSPASGATVVIVNLDGPGEGLNDPAAAAPVGGNSGTTVGQQRLVVFQRAAEIWGEQLASTVPIRVAAKFDPLACTSTSATLGSAGPEAVVRDFDGAPLPNTYYAVALANALAGEDLDPGNDDITATFNSNLGTQGCLSIRPWYYGLDGNTPPNSINLIETVLHEMVHGLGFISTVNASTGGRLNGFNDSFMYHLEDHTTGKTYPQMTDAERRTAATQTGNLHWVGTNVIALSHILAAGRGPGGHVEMYAPNPVEPGSSVSHFSSSLSPDELMEPFATATVDYRLTTELFKDIGWRVGASGASIVASGSAILSESCAAANGLMDPNENLTVSFSLRNVGNTNTGNVVATLLATGGVAAPSAPQSYGGLATNSAAVARSFSFVANGGCGGTVTATLQLQDGTNDLGMATFAFKLGTTLSFTNPASIGIPLSGPASAYPSAINVPGPIQPLSSLTVKLFNVNHDNPDDLDILLVGPGGETVVLMSDAGGSSDISATTLTFDDQAANSLPDSSQISSGTYKPTNLGAGDSFPSPAPAGPHGSTLSVFNGTNPNGTWSLYVNDDGHPRSGSIASGWSLTFTVCCAGSSNAAPTIVFSNSILSYVENSGAIVIDSTAIATDSDSADFQGGALTVEITANGSAADHLAIRHEGTGPGQIGLSGSAVTFGGLSIGTFSGGTNGSSPLVINFTSANATVAAAQALLRNLTFENVSESPSTLSRTLRVTISDGDGAAGQPATKTVAVSVLNDAPVLDSSGNPVLTSINEDIPAAANTGTVVSALIGNSISDVDAGALRGLAVSAVDNANGDWQYSTNAGAVWMNFGAVTEGNARLLATNASIRFLPGSNSHGTATITYRAWDRTAGGNGSAADVSVNGGITAFSTNTESARITILPVNDPPMLAVVGNQSLNEGETLVITNAANDPDSSDLLVFTLVAGPPGIALNATNGLFVWTPDETQGPGTNLVAIAVSDDGVPSLSVTQSFSVIVLEVNAAPVLASISDRVIYQGTSLSVTNFATDIDLPGNTLSFSLSNAPMGAAIDSVSGLFTWTPAPAQANTTNMISVVVTDNGTPALTDIKEFSITVLSAPFIESIVLNGTNVTLVWSAIPGTSYRVQFKTNLDETAWNDLPGEVTASSANATKMDSAGTVNQRFYRILAAP